MFSKNKYAALFIAVMTLGGCSEYLDGKKTDNQVIEMSNVRLECLKELPRQMKEFSLGQSSKTDIDETFSCLQYSLGYFRDRTEGSFANAYSAEDMRIFFGKYFLRDNNISPHLAKSFMRLKKALMGGSEEHITKAEITQVIELLKDLNAEVVELQPHILLLTLQSEPGSASEDSVKLALKQVRKSLQNVLANLNIQRSDYSFDEAKLLLSSLSEFIAGPQTFNFLDQTEAILPVAQSIKEIIFGTDSFLISEKEWKAGLDSLVDLYGLFLRYHYVLQGTTPDSLKRIEQYLTYGDDCLALIEASHQMRRRAMIPFDPINRLLELGATRNFIPGNLTAVSIEKTYQIALRKVFESYQGTDNRGFEYLELRHLAAIRRELKVFQGNLKLIISLNGNAQFADFAELLKDHQLNRISEAMTTSPIEQEAILAGLNDFVGLIMRRSGLKIGEKAQLLLKPQNPNDSWSWQGLVTLNLIHSVSRLLMLGYGERDVMHLGEGRLSSKALSQWYQDFNDLGQELKIFDPRSVDPGARSTREANYFTFSGNGDDKIDFIELNEFLSLLVSGGAVMGPEMKLWMDQAHCQTQKRDLFNDKKYSETCIRDQFRQFLMSKKSEMPGLVRHFQGMDIARFNIQFYQMLSLVRAIDAEPGFLELSEVRALGMILHYSETLFITSDLDHDDRLSSEEVRRAAPRFRGLIKDKIPFDDDVLADDVFVFLVMKGKTPDLWSYTFERAKDYLGFSQETFANRDNIIQVMSAMKAMSKP